VSRSKLSTRLYRRVLLLIAVTGMAMGLILYIVARNEIARTSDAQLVNASRLLYMMMQDDIPAQLINVENDRSLSSHGPLSPKEKIAFQATYDWCMFTVLLNGRPIAQSGWGAPIRSIPRTPGFRDFNAMGDSWRSYGLSAHQGKLLIVVAERNALGEFSIIPVIRRLTLPLVLLIAAGMLMLWWMLRKSLSEVDRLISTIYRRNLTDLTLLEPSEWSLDLEPLIIALNKLFVRLGEAYEQEQAVTDDVAHELRTPLAVIRTQAQLLQKSAPDILKYDTTRLINSVDRANCLIGGMLTLARLNATAIASRLVDVHAIVADVVAGAMISVPDLAMDFTVSPDHIVRWQCDVEALTLALSAVIDNAINHARAGGSIDIVIAPSREELTIMVSDRGPGIDELDRERLLQRFERGRSTSSGSGLGLSIAVKAMALGKGAVFLSNREDGQGLSVTLTLPIDHRVQ
jgi:two-component system sensor histidine kinase QseC